MSDNDSGKVTMQIDGHVCTISVDNVSKKNAYTPAMLDRLAELQAFQPPVVGLRPVALAVIALAVAEEKRQRPLFGLPLQMLHVLPRSRQIT